MKTLILLTGFALTLVCWGGKTAEPSYERGVVTEVSNVGPPMDHWFIMQTECCNYTIKNWRLFSGLTIGGHNDVWIRDNTAFIRVGKNVAKAPILKAEQREGFDPSLFVVFDPQGDLYRTGDIASLPNGWEIAARDTKNEMHTLSSAILPQGWQFLHGIGGIPLPPILRGTKR